MSISGIIMQLAFMFGPGVGAGLSQLNIRAPFYVGAITSAIALLVAYFNVKTPSEIEQMEHKERGVEPKADEEAQALSKKESSDEKAEAPTNWSLVLLTGMGSLLTSFAMSSGMTCSARKHASLWQKLARSHL